MINPDQLQKVDKFIKSLNISDVDILPLFANLLLSKVNSYEEVDLYSKRLPEIYLKDYSDFFTIKNHIEFNKDSLSLEVGVIVHKLLYIFNQIKLEEEKKYGRKSNPTD